MTEISAAPGAATRRYLDAVRDRGPLPADWRSAPTRHKRYPTASRLALPWPPGGRAGDAATGAIGELLRQLLGLARVIWYHAADDAGTPTGQPPLLLLGRPAPSGGALYPIEAYLATDGTGPPAGLYHYDPVHHGLERMRAGDHREPLRLALAAGRQPQLVLVLTAVFWRSMVKYGDFGYRLICQETGVLLAQALAVGDRLGLAAEPRLLFDDGQVEHLLGLDAAREGALAALTLTLPGAPRPPGDPGAGSLAAESAPRPPPMPFHDAAATLHRATRTPVAPRDRTVVDRAVPPPERRAGTTRLPPGQPVRLADGVAGRSSPASGYLPVPVSLPALASVLAAAATPYPADLPGTSDGLVTTAWYLLALRVDGLATGAYRYERSSGELLQVSGGGPVEEVGAAPRLLSNTHSALAGAAAALIPVGCPLAGVEAYGDRWYRLQQIETGLAVHRATLAAVACGLAARIHSDGANATTDTVLGLGTGGWQSQSFLLLGTARAGGRLLARRLSHRTPEGGAQPC